MEIFLLRHGQTDANVAGVVDDNPLQSTSLTMIGRKQARKIGLALRIIPFDAMYISEFDRTFQTAEIVNVARDIPIFTDRRINEFHSGMNGQSSTLADSYFYTSFWDVRYEDSETFNELYVRIVSFLEDLKNRSEQCVLVVSHGDPLLMMHAYLSGVPKLETFQQKGFDNCEVRRYIVN